MGFALMLSDLAWFASANSFIALVPYLWLSCSCLEFDPEFGLLPDIFLQNFFHHFLGFHWCRVRLLRLKVVGSEWPADCLDLLVSCWAETSSGLGNSIGSSTGMSDITESLWLMASRCWKAFTVSFHDNNGWAPGLCVESAANVELSRLAEMTEKLRPLFRLSFPRIVLS